jgi:2-C-methyl-D-erythritol 4-phosphate cytidylyltransferase
LLAWQKPIAARREDVLRGLSLHHGSEAARGTHDPGILEVLRLAGVLPSAVRGSVANFKLTDPDDLEVARAILAGGGAGVAS